MFPEITRDDVFRLETRRLWLRWPVPEDAAALAAMTSLREGRAADGPPHVLWGDADRRIAQWREQNRAGDALVLLITGREADRTPIGAVSVEATPEARLSVQLRPDQQGLGFATEAVQAIVDATFTLSSSRDVSAWVRVVHPAARRVFERCGFAYESTLLYGTPADGGMVPCDRFRLDRKAWASLKLWRMPIIGGRGDPAALSADPA